MASTLLFAIICKPTALPLALYLTHFSQSFRTERELLGERTVFIYPRRILIHCALGQPSDNLPPVLVCILSSIFTSHETYSCPGVSILTD